MKEVNYFLHCTVAGCDSIIIDTNKVFDDARSDVNVIWIRHRNTVAFQLSKPAHLVQSFCHFYVFRCSLKTYTHPKTKPKQNPQVRGVSLLRIGKLYCTAAAILSQ